MGIELKLALLLVLGLILIWSGYYLYTVRKKTGIKSGEKTGHSKETLKEGENIYLSEPRPVCPYCETINQLHLRQCAACGARLDR